MTTINKCDIYFACNVLYNPCIDDCPLSSIESDDWYICHFFLFDLNIIVPVF